LCKWDVPIEAMGSVPAVFADGCAEIVGIKACSKHRTQASRPNILMDLIVRRSFLIKECEWSKA
jgi:hypothetical protein